MPHLHVCNTFFEKELENGALRPLSEWFRSHPIVLQLQFLPLLYAGPSDRILVSDLPDSPDPRLVLSGEGPIELWGHTRAVQTHMPDWEVVRTVNSKIFSFLESPKLPGADALTTEQEVNTWIENTPGRKVLKTAFGTAGNGHFHIDRSKNLAGFLKQLPLIGEPWVERLFDFSTQWKDGVLLGATVFENDPNGTYQGTIAGPVESIFGEYMWALEEHIACVRPILKKIREMGFFGNLGIDAYVYKRNNNMLLQPVVEINGRKTMSWVALQMQIKNPGTTIQFTYTKSTTGLLPSCLNVNGKKMHFSRNIHVRKL